MSLLKSKLNIGLKKKLVWCYVGSIALYGSETRTLRKLMYLESFEIRCLKRMERIKWLENVIIEEVLERIGEKATLLNIIRQFDRSYSEKKLPPSWCHWRTGVNCKGSRKKKNTAPWWFEKHEKILGAKGGGWGSKGMETTVYQSNISIFHKSLDLLISSIL